MPIQLTCPCGRRLQIRTEFAGQQGKCPSCGQMLDIPAAEEAQPVLPVGRAVPVDEAVAEAPQGAAVPAEEPAPQGEPATEHNGDEVPAHADFFARPPEEIGEVTSAHTSLKRGQRPMSPTVRQSLLVGVGLLGAAIGAAVSSQLADTSHGFWMTFWGLVVGGLGVVVVHLTTRFHHTCTFVGREGVAHYECSGSRDRLTRRDVFRFRDATEVRSAQTDHYTNGAYTHTSFSLSWNDVGGRVRYVISGKHQSKNNRPPRGSLAHFARAAEIAWTVYLLGQAYRQIDLSGTVLFNLRGGKWVRLGPGLVIVCLQGKPEECAADELAGTSVQKGVVCIRRHDARQGWFSSTGVYRFDFAELANAQLFFHLMEKVVGISVQ